MLTYAVWYNLFRQDHLHEYFSLLFDQGIIFKKFIYFKFVRNEYIEYYKKKLNIFDTISLLVLFNYFKKY